METWFNVLLIVCALAIPFTLIALCLGVCLELRDWIRGKPPKASRRKKPAARRKVTARR